MWKISLLLGVVLTFWNPVLGFFGAGTALKRTPSPLAEEAVQIFDKKYPFGRDPPKSIGFGDFGMPNRDIDGTPLKKQSNIQSNKRLTDITQEQATASFSALAAAYGEERALDMVKALPLCLAFDKSVFGPSLREWSQVFGEEEAKEMVRRNPGLLAVKPEEASRSTDQTMTFSYIVAATRPLGPFLLSSLALLLLIPAFEAITGLQIQSTVAEFLK